MRTREMAARAKRRSILDRSANRRRATLSRRLIALPLLSGLPLLLASCAYLPPPLKRVVTGGEIEQQRQQFNQLVAFRRMADLGRLVTDDVQLISPSKTVSGRKNLIRSQERLVQQRPDLIQVFTPERVQRNPHRPVAAERGHWTESWQAHGEAIELRGSYYALWKREGDQWHLYSQTVTPLSCKGEHFCKSQEPHE